MGEYREIHTYNRVNTANYNYRVFSFTRWSAFEKLVIVSNFDDLNSYEFELKLPETIVQAWNLNDGKYQLREVLYDQNSFELIVKDGLGFVKLKIDPLASYLLNLEIK